MAETSDELILVDPEDNVVGHLDKEACHRGAGIRHRAFSVFLFDRNGRVLLQKRAMHKPLWPGFWSNSVCSHPRRGESVEAAAARRIPEELGIACRLRSLFRFEYQALDTDRGAEHELCWVLAGRVADIDLRALSPDRDEVERLEWTAVEELDRLIASEPNRYTPWLRLEWQRLRDDQAPALAGALAQLADD